MLEKLFEGMIWRSRFIVILAVIFGLLGAFILFIIASMDIWQVGVISFQVVTHAIPHPEHFHEDVVAVLGDRDARAGDDEGGDLARALQPASRWRLAVHAAEIARLPVAVTGASPTRTCRTPRPRSRSATAGPSSPPGAW